jgi:hypothetical protein
MPIAVTWEERGVLLEFSGKITVVDYREALMAMSLDSRFQEIDYVICDYGGIEPDPEGIRFGMEQVEVVAAFVTGLMKERSFVVAIVANNSGTLEKAKHYAGVATHSFEILTNMIDARNWIKSAIQ